VYLITNLDNDDFYIGKTIKEIEERFSGHKYNYKKTDTYLYRAMRKYGIDKFEISVLESVDGDLEELNQREKYWIEKLKPTYNMTSGGDGGDTSLSEKYQKYMLTHSERMTGENNPFYGKKHNEFSKKLISQKKTGVRLSEETKEKIRKANFGKKMSKESIEKTSEKKSKIWRIITPEGKEIIIKNLSRFCQENGLDQRNMSKVAAGIYKSSKGYKCAVYND
jgi:group I intron endonuclease